MRLDMSKRKATSIDKACYEKIAQTRAEIFRDTGIVVSLPLLIDAGIDAVTREDIKTSYTNGLIESLSKKKKKA